MTLPNGQDPDDLVRARGRGAMDALLAEPQPLADRRWANELAAEPLDTPEQRVGLKRRLQDLAATIADSGIRFEYQSEFRRRADKHLAPPPRAPFVPGRRGPPKPPAGGDHPHARAVGAGGIDPVLARAVLAGLIRHPAEIARHLEVLGSLRLADGALGRLFEAVVDVALEDRTLDSPRLVSILAKSGFDTIAAELLRADRMPYSFTLAGADPDRARAELDEAIAILAARPEVDAALAEATRVMRTYLSDEAFERQVALVRERQALEQRLANLMQANEDARVGATEGD